MSGSFRQVSRKLPSFLTRPSVEIGRIGRTSAPGLHYLPVLLGAFLVLSDGGLASEQTADALRWAGITLVALRFAFALLVRHMPDSEWVQTARSPYTGRA